MEQEIMKLKDKLLKTMDKIDYGKIKDDELESIKENLKRLNELIKIFNKRAKSRKPKPNAE